MTEKEKAKAYDEAVERTKKIYGNGIIEEIFPELKEEDAERIRKNCIHFIELQKQHHAATFEIEECIDWLEKQGLYNETQKSPSIPTNSLNNGKNKPKFKNEQKFKVGNWYQCTKSFYGKGVDFDKNTSYYCAIEGCLQDEYGCHIAIVKDLYDNFKLWTIQDAKEGDVLALSWLEDKNLWEKIIIFKNYHSDGVKGLYTPCVEGYGNTFKNRKMAFNEKVPYCSKTWTCNLHPATKEQRDLLFQKIKETGYKWNAETKTLEKLVESKFDPKTLQPFDKVLTRDVSLAIWRCQLFSNINKNEENYPYLCVSDTYKYCIPYNDDTKHLVGTNEEAPEFYRYWED